MGFPRALPLLACLLLGSLCLAHCANTHPVKVQSAVEDQKEELACPGITTCAQSGLDVLVTLDNTKLGHVTRVTNLTTCQQFCHTTKHLLYRFQPRSAPRAPLCYCFDGCASVVGGPTTVGSTSACFKPAAADVARPAVTRSERYEPLKRMEREEDSTGSRVQQLLLIQRLQQQRQEQEEEAVQHPEVRQERKGSEWSQEQQLVMGLLDE